MIIFFAHGVVLDLVVLNFLVVVVGISGYGEGEEAWCSLATLGTELYMLS